jgi:hypothetical protein
LSTTNRVALVLVLAAAAGVAAPIAASAQNVSRQNTARGQTRSFWTAERLAGAKPIAMRPRSVGTEAAVSTVAEAAVTDQAPARSMPGEAAGSLPLSGIGFNLDYQRLVPAGRGPVESAVDEAGAVVDEAAGGAKAHFTSSGLIPRDAQYEYPYSTVGALFFYDSWNDETYYCNAAVIRKRIIVTAASCIHSGDNRPGFFDDHVFFPAWDGGDPLGSWEWNYVVVNNTWANGGGTVPSPVDYGLIELEDVFFNGATRKIGDVTGTLGYVIKKLHPNHAHLLGFDDSFDGGEYLHQSTAQALKKILASNVAEYGSDIDVAGAAFIQDFGRNANLVKWIGALSYYRLPASQKLVGGSIPDTRFTSLLTTACAHRSGNC